MEPFLRELEIGDIHIRDKWQFELKSEFFPNAELGISTYTQEFYLFIPNALRVNEETYSKAQFYQDQTNLIRYKTPEFELSQLSDKNNIKSPLTRLQTLKDLPQTKENISNIENELKLFGNIFRSALRERGRRIFEWSSSSKSHHLDMLEKKISLLCHEIHDLRSLQISLFHLFLEEWSAPEMPTYFTYIDEFISNSIEYYLTRLLESLKNLGIPIENINVSILSVLIKEKQYREGILCLPAMQNDNSPAKNEWILYRSGLLDKFVLDALLLPVSRSSLDQRFSNLIGSISAGFAMLVFLLLFAWQGQVFLINSLPFIFITVILYILKDRMKEGLKALSYRQCLKWFSDYITDIYSPNGQAILGKLSESFSFVNQQKLSKEIKKIRKREFHSILETFQRPEQVIYYKKVMKLYRIAKLTDQRRNALNLIFRFNISNFLRMADNPMQEYVTMNPVANELHKIELPKVYHVNIIMKNTYILSNLSNKVELKKFRLVIDKNGIRRIELVTQ
jgi:hypothetical protein